MMRLRSRLGFQFAPLLALLLFSLATTAAAQESLFEQRGTEREDTPMTEAQKAAGEKESIF